MKIRWTEESLDQSTNIEAYIAKDSPARAVHFVDQIIEYVLLLENNPRAGRMVPEISNPDIRELIFQKYRVVYKLKEKQIEILTVFEGHKLLQTESHLAASCRGMK